MSLGGEVTREHLPRRVGHGAEAARLGDAVGGVRAGLTAAGLGPECGCERAEVVRDSLLRLGSDEGEGEGNGHAAGRSKGSHRYVVPLYLSSTRETACCMPYVTWLSPPRTCCMPTQRP